LGEGRRGARGDTRLSHTGKPLLPHRGEIREKTGKPGELVEPLTNPEGAFHKASWSTSGAETILKREWALKTWLG